MSSAPTAPILSNEKRREQLRAALDQDFKVPVPDDASDEDVEGRARDSLAKLVSIARLAPPFPNSLTRIP